MGNVSLFTGQLSQERWQIMLLILLLVKEGTEKHEIYEAAFDGHF